MQQPLQLFFWTEFCHQDYATQRTYYKGFTLQETTYAVGDTVFLLPSNPSEPFHIGCIQSAYSDCSPGASEAHCIEVGTFGASRWTPPKSSLSQVRWFERVSALFPNDGKGGSEKELVELQEVDTNPIGCLVGPCNVIRARSYAEVRSERADGSRQLSDPRISRPPGSATRSASGSIAEARSTRRRTSSSSTPTWVLR